eukprot:g7225.t1
MNMMKLIVMTTALVRASSTSSMYDYDRRSPLGTFSAETTLNTPYDEDQIYALSSNAEIVAIGKSYDSDIYVDTRVYEIESDGSLKQVGANISVPSDTLALSNDGTILAVGHVGNNQRFSEGFVNVYKFNGTHWTQRGGSIKSVRDTGSIDWTGKSISLSADGDMIAVGSPNADTLNGYKGFVQVYEYDHGRNDWILRGQELCVDNITAGSAGVVFFGMSLDLTSDGSYLAVGLNGRIYDGSNGAYVYSWNGTNYNAQDGNIENVDTFGNVGYIGHHYYNTKVAIDDSGSTLVVGNSQYRVEDFYGRVTVYNRASSTWTLSTSFLGATDGLDGETFAKDIYLSNDGTKMLVRSDSMLYMSNNKFTSYDFDENDWKVSSIVRSSLKASPSPDMNYFVVTNYFAPNLVLMSYEETVMTTREESTTTEPVVTTESADDTTTTTTTTVSVDDGGDNDNSNDDGDAEDVLLIVIVAASVVGIAFLIGAWLRCSSWSKKANIEEITTNNDGKQHTDDFNTDSSSFMDEL